MPASNPELNKTYNDLLPLIEQTNAYIGNLAGSGCLLAVDIRNARDEGSENLSCNDLVLPGATVDVKRIQGGKIIVESPHPFRNYEELKSLTVDVAISLEPASTGLVSGTQNGSILLTHTGLAKSELLSSPSDPEESVEVPAEYDNYYTYEQYKTARRAACYETPEKMRHDYAVAMITRVTLAALVGEIINGTALQVGLNERVFSDGDPHELLRSWAESVRPKTKATFLGQVVSLKKLPHHPLVASVVANPRALVSSI